MNENVKVVVRCRPMSQKERESKCENIIEIEDYTMYVLNPSDRSAPKKAFTFDSVYDCLSMTEVIYNDLCYPLVESTLEGYNGTIFAYGQTGCGKTHTMQGEGNFKNGQNEGVIPRCFDHIFETISMANDAKYLAFVSYLEIYNENIRDLLSLKGSDNLNHPLKEVSGIGITVPSLSTHTVVNSLECYKLLSTGNKNKITGATLINETSSRSHTIFTISLEQIQGPSQTSEELSGGVRRGKLSLVDLAGSERQRKTAASGERLKEATKINLSLSALGNVISSLVDGKTKHVPYRDSKLTRLLQDSLGGNTKTLMISCVSPANTNYDETLSTLRYASRAKKISNIPKINEDPKDAKLRQYQVEIQRLKKMLDETYQKHENHAAQNFNNCNIPSQLWLEDEKTKLRQEMEAEMAKIKELQDSNVLETSKRNEVSTCKNVQLQARKRIDYIKNAIIGGERVNDLQLKERHRRRKKEVQRHLSAIAHALSRVEKNGDRDLLQGHYTNIQQEINSKNENIKKCHQKIKTLEREISDLNSEFQLDREDYLDEIRGLGRNLKFYQQLLRTVIPILRKNGKSCSQRDPEIILEKSTWNDDNKVWLLPELVANPLKLPTANLSYAFLRSNDPTINCEKHLIKNVDDEVECNAQTSESYKVNILKNYFRSNRQNGRKMSNQKQNFNITSDGKLGSAINSYNF